MDISDPKKFVMTEDIMNKIHEYRSINKKDNMNNILVVVYINVSGLNKPYIPEHIQHWSNIYKEHFKDTGIEILVAPSGIDRPVELIHPLFNSGDDVCNNVSGDDKKKTNVKRV